jgi:hypothetical protein
VLIVCAVVLHVVPSVLAAPPPSINRLFSQTGQFNDRDRKDVDAFARYYAGQLLSDDLSVAEAARNALLTPLVSPGTGATFTYRNVLSPVLIPRLTPIIDDQKRPMAAMNAMRIICELGTPRSLETLIAHCSRLDEPRGPIRLWSARGIRRSIERGIEFDSIRVVKQKPAVRRISDAVREEDDWRVLHWQLDSLAALTQVKPQQVSDEARDELFRAVDSVIETLEAKTQADMMFDSIRPALSGMRTLFSDAVIDLVVDHDAIGKDIAPRLVQILKIPDLHADARDDARLRIVYERVIRQTENLLGFIDGAMDGQMAPTKLEKTYKSDRQEYHLEVVRIEDLTEQPPYRQ